jgi:hypothetical protein
MLLNSVGKRIILKKHLKSIKQNIFTVLLINYPGKIICQNHIYTKILKNPDIYKTKSKTKTQFGIA